MANLIGAARWPSEVCFDLCPFHCFLYTVSDICHSLLLLMSISRSGAVKTSLRLPGSMEIPLVQSRQVSATSYRSSSLARHFVAVAPKTISSPPRSHLRTRDFWMLFPSSCDVFSFIVASHCWLLVEGDLFAGWS